MSAQVSISVNFVDRIIFDRLVFQLNRDRTRCFQLNRALFELLFLANSSVGRSLSMSLPAQTA